MPEYLDSEGQLPHGNVKRLLVLKYVYATDQVYPAFLATWEEVLDTIAEAAFEPDAVCEVRDLADEWSRGLYRASFQVTVTSTHAPPRGTDRTMAP